MAHEKLFWDATFDELKQGYVLKDDQYICLSCGKSFEVGVIYPHDNLLLDSKKAVSLHIETKHQSMFHYLIDMDKRYTGITDHQKQLMLYFYQGLSDKEIAKITGGNPSTIRTQRFTLREKAKQAKIFLALMASLEHQIKKDDSETFVDIHVGATHIDDRYITTEQEKKTILETYFDLAEPMRLKTFPTKQKRKLIILQQFASKFKPDYDYTEKEVNEIIKVMFDDYVTIRRYLIEYGFLKRTQDGSKYWLHS